MKNMASKLPQQHDFSVEFHKNSPTGSIVIKEGPDRQENGGIISLTLFFNENRLKLWKP
jgi:hypothetical protein